MATAAELELKVQQAINANESGDYDGALQYLTSARMMLIAMPDQSAGGGSMNWDRGGIDALIQEVKQAKARAAMSRYGGMQRTKIIRRRTSCED